MLIWSFIPILLARSVKIITRDGCHYSEMMRDYLNRLGVDYTDYNISKLHHDFRNDFGLAGRTFPAVIVDGEYKGGYTDVISSGLF